MSSSSSPPIHSERLDLASIVHCICIVKHSHKAPDSNQTNLNQGVEAGFKKMSVMQLHVPRHKCRASASLPTCHFARHHDPLQIQQPQLKLTPPTAIAEDCHEQEGQDHEPFREKVFLRSTRMVHNAFCKNPRLALHRQLLSSCARGWAAQTKSAMNCSTQGNIRDGLHLVVRWKLQGSRLIFRREGKWPFDEFHAMLKSLKFHWEFCFVCGVSWQKLCFFSSAKCG